MKKMVYLLMVILLLSVSFTSTAFASGRQPTGGCAPGFEIHPFMDPSVEQMHTHIGLDQDLNGDGFICMQMVSPDTCLLVDDTIPKL